MRASNAKWVLRSSDQSSTHFLVFCSTCMADEALKCHPRNLPHCLCIRCIQVWRVRTLNRPSAATDDFGERSPLALTNGSCSAPDQHTRRWPIPSAIRERDYSSWKRCAWIEIVQPLVRRPCHPANFLPVNASSARPDYNTLELTVQLAIKWSENQSFE